MSVTDKGKFHHTAFIVKDIEKTAATLAKSLSIKWGLWTVEPTASTVHGQDVHFSFRAAFAQVGEASYELIEPLSGESVYVEHLKTKGEGFHHTCIAYPSVEALRMAKDELVNQGREIVQSAMVGEAAEFYYFDIPELGSILELLYLAESEAHPEKTIG